MESYLFILLIFMIVGSIIAIESKNLLSSVISCGVVGFSVSIAFLMLQAPDIAITQVVEKEIRALPDFSNGLIVWLAVSAVFLLGMQKRSA